MSKYKRWSWADIKDTRHKWTVLYWQYLRSPARCSSSSKAWRSAENLFTRYPLDLATVWRSQPPQRQPNPKMQDSLDDASHTEHTPRFPARAFPLRAFVYAAHAHLKIVGLTITKSDLMCMHPLSCIVAVRLMATA